LSHGPGGYGPLLAGECKGGGSACPGSSEEGGISCPLCGKSPIAPRQRSALD
jgi:hypothetical protein